MATSLSTLVTQTRRFLQDYPEEDALTASVASNGTSITIADGTKYHAGDYLELEQELLYVSANGSGTTATVRRGMRGSTAASHANGTTILYRPRWSYVEIVDALNWAKDECFPLIYKDVLDTSLTTSATAYEYTIPSLGGLPIRYVSQVELKASGETDYREVRWYAIRRGATPKIQFSVIPDAGATIRIHGYSNFPDLTTGSSLDAQWPTNADKLLPLGAASYLLMSSEAKRARVDAGAQDDRESANRVGSSMSVANSLDARFRRGLQNAAMPPLPRHIKPTF